MLDTLTSDDFKDLLNDEFETSFDGSPVTLRLSAIDVMDERYSQPDARVSFSLTFLGPPETPLPQGMYSLRHAKFGALELFAVPIGPGEDGPRYETVFN